VEIKKKLKGGVERAVQSSDYKNIYSAVIDTYTNNTVLKNFAEVGYWRRGQTVRCGYELRLGKWLVQELYSGYEEFQDQELDIMSETGWGS
jgi:hypothetical protein